MSNFKFNELFEYVVQHKLEDNTINRKASALFKSISETGGIDEEALITVKDFSLELFFQYFENEMPKVRIIDDHNKISFEVSILETPEPQFGPINLGGEGNSHRISAILYPVKGTDSQIEFPSFDKKQSLKEGNAYIVPPNMTYRFLLNGAETSKIFCFFITLPQ